MLNSTQVQVMGKNITLPVFLEQIALKEHMKVIEHILALNLRNQITVMFTSHRVEYLPIFEEIAKKNDIIVLEEPKNKAFIDFLNDKITADEYVSSLNTTFPVYTFYEALLLKKLYHNGKIIMQSEPYLEILERIYSSIIDGKISDDPEIKMIKTIEGKCTEKLIKYHESFLKGDFDEMVQRTIEFSKADAQRFKVRDYMRAKEIVKIADKTDKKLLVEAGQIHVLLPEYIKRLSGKDVDVISIPEIAANYCGIKMIDNPGNELTKIFILNKKCNEENLKLLAARGLIYISMISKTEMLPSRDKPFPHLLEETKIAEFAYSLSYDECKKKFFEIWRKKKE